MESLFLGLYLLIQLVLRPSGMTSLKVIVLKLISGFLGFAVLKS